jgi:ubiquinol-cytochrome c reductase cytochrome b subunit
MGLAIGYGVAQSVPVIGGNLSLAIWGAPFPGAPQFESRMFIGHVFLLPALIATLIVVHVILIAAKHHTQFRTGPRASERVLIGVPTFPGQAPRSIGLMLAVAAVLFLLGGLVQINPIWLWGPFEPALGTNGAQPDWYLGWLIGGLRLMPGFDVTIGDYTLVPNPFWGGALFPIVVLMAMLLYPWLERRFTRDHAAHNLLDRPRDAPTRTGIGAAFLAWVVLVFVAGSSDRMTVFLGLSYVGQIWFWRFAVFLVPLALYFVTRRLCVALQKAEQVEETRELAEQEAERAAEAVPEAVARR